MFYELSFQILPEDQRRLRAIELSVPSTVATFQVKHRNSYGIVTDARVYNIDLNSGGLEITGGSRLMRISLLRISLYCDFSKNSINLPYANFGLFYFISAIFWAKIAKKIALMK